jgi:hypothetical protein
MFFNTNMKLYITLLENVNKSRTSASRLSLIKQIPVTTKAMWEVRHVF